MPERSSIALLLIVAGLVVVMVGVLFWLGLLSWFGRLPGDVRVDRPGFRFYAPITSMIVLSVVLTILMAVIRRVWP